MKIVVLDGFAVNPGDLDWSFLGKYGEYTVYDSTKADEAGMRCADAEAVFTNRVKIDEEFFKTAQRVRYVSALGTGYDMIDIQACRRHGVEVCNIPAYSSDTVAQLAFTLLLNITTDINGLSGIVHSGKWTGVPGFRYQTVKFTELADKTLGLIGYGGIGKRMAEIAAGFKMNILAVTRTKQCGSDGRVCFVTQDELLRRSDAISLHCPLTPETTGMVNSEFISKMKDGAYLINTARGAILNEDDVAAALNAGKLGGIGVDVLAIEPPRPDNPLLTAKNCLITPHSAWTAIEARRRLLSILEKNLKAFAETGKGLNSVINKI